MWQFQETLTNITRHAEATKVKIHLIKEVDKLMLEVVDNGKGITKEQMSKPNSFGLMGMHERVNFWRGEIKILGEKDKGTTVKVSIPLEV